MNPYQIVGVIAGCSLVFAGVVVLLAMQGVPVMVAFLLVYAVALVSMLGMQRRARQSCEEAAERDGQAVRPSRRATSRTRGSRTGTDDLPATVVAEPLRVAVGEVRY